MVCSTAMVCDLPDICPSGKETLRSHVMNISNSESADRCARVARACQPDRLHLKLEPCCFGWKCDSWNLFIIAPLDLRMYDTHYHWSWKTGPPDVYRRSWCSFARGGGALASRSAWSHLCAVDGRCQRPSQSRGVLHFVVAGRLGCLR